MNSFLSPLLTWFESKSGKTFLAWFDRGITVFLLGILIYQLYGMPLTTILKGLPTNPLFYLLWYLAFFLVPASEYFIYKLKWTYDGIEYFKGYMLKKIYNNELYNYTGEAFFVKWISDRIEVSKKDAFLFIKDNNIVSSLASTLLSFLLLFALSIAGLFDILALISETDTLSLVVGTCFLIVAVVFAYQFRSKILHIDRGLFWKMFAWYSGRYVVRHTLLVLTWVMAAPEVSLLVWVNFMLVKVILDRLPIGNRNLILLSMSPWLSTTFDVSVEIFTGIQIMFTVLDKITYTITLMWARKNAPKTLDE